VHVSPPRGRPTPRHGGKDSGPLDAEELVAPACEPAYEAGPRGASGLVVVEIDQDGVHGALEDDLQLSEPGETFESERVLVEDVRPELSDVPGPGRLREPPHESRADTLALPGVLHQDADVVGAGVAGKSGEADADPPDPGGRGLEAGGLDQPMDTDHAVAEAVEATEESLSRAATRHVEDGRQVVPREGEEKRRGP
jgi:hypothetical protein